MTGDRGRARGPHLAASLHPVLLAHTTSAAADLPLLPHDIAGSLAHVVGLEAAGLLSASDAKALTGALQRVLHEAEGGQFSVLPEDEDVHMAVERRVTELEPHAGPRLHTGRSRNDQVALDLRLWARAEARGLSGALARLTLVVAELALAEAGTLMPGYTHLQRAQPVTLGHHLLAYAEMFERDAARLRETHDRAGRSPLGAGALAGSTLPLQPELTAAHLGLLPPRNSLDAVSDRDFLLDLAHAALTIALHLSRLGEEIVLWVSAEFGFVELPDEVATGSSLMPQKRNPDVAELLRGRAGEALGAVVALATVLKGLPLAYNRDLQEREPVFRSVAATRLGLEAAAVLLAALRFDRDRMATAAADPGLRATDLADDLVRDGMPFRQAHAEVAAAHASHPGTVDPVAAARSLAARDVTGSPHPTRVRREARAAARRAASVLRWSAESAP